ncbi:MAG: hypothetical protein R3D25_15385 [Geminicoccaceae bacterium]
MTAEDAVIVRAPEGVRRFGRRSERALGHIRRRLVDRLNGTGAAR